jgi:hypothetical protein
MKEKNQKSTIKKEDDALLGIFLLKLITLRRRLMLTIDLEKLKKQLNETTFEAMAYVSKKLLQMLYGDDVQVVANINEQEGKPDFIIKGKYRDVKAYSKAIVSMKNFLDAFNEFGKEHPQTEKTKHALRGDVDHFEQISGLKWPFKDED